MSNDNTWERHAKLTASIGKMLLDDTRSVEDLNSIHQDFVDNARWKIPAAGPVEKFALFCDLGEITVPANYMHRIRLDSFKAEYQNDEHKSFYYYNDALTDENFPNPSRVLKPGDKIHVRAFTQTVSGTTTSDERMAFLRSQKNVFLGAQGASLVWEEKRRELPKGKWYCSFDEKNRLPVVDGCHGVPCVRAYSDGDFSFSLGGFEGDWRDSDVLLCFRDKPFAN